jgi:hypothetical protein
VLVVGFENTNGIGTFWLTPKFELPTVELAKAAPVGILDPSTALISRVNEVGTELNDIGNRTSTKEPVKPAVKTWFCGLVLLETIHMGDAL